MTEEKNTRQRLPRWLKMKLPKGENYSRVKNLATKNNLHTICTSGNCPNIGECWSRGTATFMILGDICTRNCRFCAVKTGKPAAVNPEEPLLVSKSIKLMNLKHCVITSVDRDDLPDLGTDIWVKTIVMIKELNPDLTMEALIPDFQGKKDLITKIINADPEIISHNLETVEGLTSKIRNKNIYKRSLSVIEHISGTGKISKSGIMLGLGETENEVLQTMDDLLSAGCKIMTIGQYLAPAADYMQAVEYITPETFKKYGEIGLEKGFRFVESSPLVRSSYNAEKHVI